MNASVLRPELAIPKSKPAIARCPARVVNEKKIAPHIPVVDKSGREDGSLSRDDFTFDKVRNVYICPQGKLLHTTGYVHDGTTLLYRARVSDCGPCPLR